jgi:tetratricopeptide (TPR) repeat protein
MPIRHPIAPQQSELLSLLGYLYLRYGRLDKAVALFEALLVMDPMNSHAAQSLACAHLRRGRPDVALRHLDRLLDEGDFSALTYLLRGQALSRIGRREEAARCMMLFVAARTDTTKRESHEVTNLR